MLRVMSIIFINELIFNQKSASRYGYTFVFFVNTHTIATVGQTKRCEREKTNKDH